MNLNWGILGTGVIAKKFAEQLPLTTGGKLVAVGSRSIESAKTFAAQFGLRTFGSYESVLANPEVEAVYVSLPNHMHCLWTINALRDGKHVLCEKPMASNEFEAIDMFEAAARAKRVLIEAFMYRCHPAIRRILAMVSEGAIGEVRLIRTNFTFNRPVQEADTRYQPAMAGGSLMDVGCYCLNFARAIVGKEPTRVHAFAHLHPSGVDEYAAGTLDFGGKTLASFTCGMTVDADRITTIGGSEGFLQIDFPWLGPGTFHLTRNGKVDEFELPPARGLYAIEADAFAAVVHGQAEPWITPADTLGNMKLLDVLREQAEIWFPRQK
ncbi:MAG: Gfo/Idh/MocA family oxidoreductase [Verrucomicrobiota bacterium]